MSPIRASTKSSTSWSLEFWIPCANGPWLGLLTPILQTHHVLGRTELQLMTGPSQLSMALNHIYNAAQILQPGIQSPSHCFHCSSSSPKAILTSKSLPTSQTTCLSPNTLWMLPVTCLYPRFPEVDLPPLHPLLPLRIQPISQQDPAQAFLLPVIANQLTSQSVVCVPP